MDFITLNTKTIAEVTKDWRKLSLEPVMNDGSFSIITQDSDGYLIAKPGHYLYCEVNSTNPDKYNVFRALTNHAYNKKAVDSSLMATIQKMNIKEDGAGIVSLDYVIFEPKKDYSRALGLLIGIITFILIYFYFSLGGR